jgi:hypothetical protein
MQTPRPNSHLSIFSRHQGATRLHGKSCASLGVMPRSTRVTVTTAQTIPIIVMSTCAPCVIPPPAERPSFLFSQYCERVMLSRLNDDHGNQNMPQSLH